MISDLPKVIGIFPIPSGVHDDNGAFWDSSVLFLPLCDVHHCQISVTFVLFGLLRDIYYHTGPEKVVQRDLKSYSP